MTFWRWCLAGAALVAFGGLLAGSFPLVYGPLCFLGGAYVGRLVMEWGRHL